MSPPIGLPELPCGPYLELHGQRKRFHVPLGLKSLLEDLIVTVLHDQPENIYIHLADFMDARVAKKEAELKAKRKATRQDLRKSKSYEADSALVKGEVGEFLGLFAMFDDSSSTIVRDPNLEEDIEGYVKRKSLGIESGTSVSSVMPAETVKEFVESIGTTMDEAHHYATVIQKNFRGFTAREKMKAKKRARVEEEEATESEEESESEEEATYTVAEEGTYTVDESEMTDYEELQNEEVDSEAEQEQENIPLLQQARKSSKKKSVEQPETPEVEKENPVLTEEEEEDEEEAPV